MSPPRSSGAPSERVLHRPYRTLGRTDWSQVEIDPAGIEFNLPIAAWMALFDRVGFDVVGYHELYAPPEAEGVMYSVPADWAKDFPREQIWDLRRRGA